MYEDEMYEDEKLRRCIKCRQIPLIVAIGTFSVECDKDGFFMGNLDSVAGHELKYRVFCQFCDDINGGLAYPTVEDAIENWNDMNK